MTVGKNEYFVRDIINGEIAEPYKFTFYQKPMTLADALVRARLAKIPMARQNLIKQQEPCGETIRDIRVEKQNIPKVIKIPHEDYCYYNKARKGIVYAPPAHAIFWHNGGDTVYTYKKTAIGI